MILNVIYTVSSVFLLSICIGGTYWINIYKEKKIGTGLNSNVEVLFKANPNLINITYPNT